MVQTVFGITPFSAMQEGEQSQYQTSRLSDQAQLSRMNLEAEKQKQMATMQERAALQKAFEDDPMLDVSKLSDQIKARDKALQSPAARNNVPLMQQLLEEKRSLLRQQSETAVEAQKRSDAQNEIMTNAINSFLIDPTNTSALDVSEDIGMRNQGNLNNLKKLFAADSTIPVPTSLYATSGQALSPEDKKRSFWQLTPQEQERVKFGIRQGNEKLTAAQKDALALSKLNLGYGIAEDNARYHDGLVAAKRQEAAAKREKNQVEREKTASKASSAIPIALAKLEVSTANDVNRLTKARQDLLVKAGMPAEGVTVEHWYGAHHTSLPKEVQDAYESYNEAIANRQAAHESAKKALTGASTKVAETAKVGDKTYTRPAGWDDAKWNAYKKAVGAK